MSVLPGAEELARRAAEAARRCGVDLDAVTGDRSVRSPVNGQPLAHLAGRPDTINYSGELPLAQGVEFTV